MIDVEQRYRNYFRFLNLLYDEVEGGEIFMISMWTIGQKMGLGGQGSMETQNIAHWLKGENLIAFKTLDYQIGITHQGIKEVEDARREPDRDTEHFSPVIIQNVLNNFGSIANSPMQQGTVDSSQTTTITNQQLVTLNEIISGLKELLKSEVLSENQKEQLDTEVKTLEIHAKSKHPRLDAIKNSLRYVIPIASAVAAGSPLVLKIISLLGG